jgi:DNA-directed RNA polymerase specialized sigma24 family protein
MRLQVGTVFQKGQPDAISRTVLHRQVGRTCLLDYIPGDLEAYHRRWQAILCHTQLLIQARAGDRAAFLPLITPYQAQIFASIRRYTATDTVAQDIAQDAWATVWEKLPSYDPTRANFAAFVMHMARTMRRRAYARRGNPQALARRLQCPTRPGQAEDALLRPLIYEEFVRFTFSGINPPHQAIAYSLCQLLEWLPREVVATLAGLPLRALATMLEQDYLRVAQPPASRLPRLRSYFLPLHQAMHLPLGEVLHDPRTRATHQSLLLSITGHTALQDYFRDKTNARTCTKDIVAWRWATERRLRKILE